MNVDFSKTFSKQFEKLRQNRQLKTRATIALFLEDSTATSLRNHPLKGDWLGYSSISAGGDLRLHFRTIDAETVLFVAIGSHSQLYK